MSVRIRKHSRITGTRGLGLMAKISIYGNRHFPRGSYRHRDGSARHLIQAAGSFSLLRICRWPEVRVTSYFRVSSEPARADAVPKRKGVHSRLSPLRPCHVWSRGDVEMGISRNSNRTFMCRVVDFHLGFRTSDVPQWWRNVTGGGAIRLGAILGLEPGR